MRTSSSPPPAVTLTAVNAERAKREVGGAVLADVDDEVGGVREQGDLVRRAVAGEAQRRSVDRRGIRGHRGSGEGQRGREAHAERGASQHMRGHTSPFWVIRGRNRRR